MGNKTLQLLITKSIIMAIFFLISIKFAYAEIGGVITNVIDEVDESITSTEFDEGYIIFYFSNEKSLKSEIDSEGAFSINPKDIFCWENCNIFPKIYLKQINIVENEEVTSMVYIPYSNELSKDERELNIVMSIFKSNKVQNDVVIPSINNIDNSKVGLPDVSKEFLGNAYSIFWNGTLIVPDSTEYSFSLSITGPVHIWLDDELIYDNNESLVDTEDISFDQYLKEGTYNLKIEYITLEDYSSPNIYWSHSDNEHELIDESSLIFYSGGSKKIIIDSKKTSFVTSSLTDLRLSEIYPVGFGWTKNYDQYKIPLILIHGWGNEDLSSDQSNKKSQWWDVPSKLRNKGHVVWEIIYTPANLSNRKNAGMFSEISKNILDFHPDFYHFDVVSHSMGGLVVRGYIQNLAISQSGNPLYYKDDIRKAVLIASPMHGSYFANLVNDGVTVDSFQDCSSLVKGQIKKFIVISEATFNMEMGSDYIWDLDYEPSLLGIDYLSIAGIQHYTTYAGFNLCLNNGLDITDGIVNYRSANLLKYNIPLVLLKEEHTSLDLPWPLPNIIGINAADKTANIISEFITRNEGPARTEAIKNHLSTIDGEFYIDPDDVNAHNRIPLDGDVLIQFNNINPMSVVLRKGIDEYSLYKNERTGRWFYLYFEDINNFRTYVPPGTYDILYDVGGGLINSGLDIDIIGDTTSLKLIEDTDGDGTLDDFDSCPSTYGKYCHGCPQPTCNVCSYASCPASGAPYCMNHPTSMICDSAFRCSFDTGDNNYNVGGEYLCQGYCDGSGSCDYADSCFYDAECDPDDDDDGTPDDDDLCPNEPGPVYNNGCPFEVSDYPRPLIEDGRFSGMVVIGDLAASEDVYGAIDLHASLQYLAKSGEDILIPGYGIYTSYTINRIEVGAAKLASEIADVTAQSLLIIGGPCANGAAAEVLGNPADCTAGFEHGKGLIQLIDTGAGSYVILVAGYTANDTRRATLALQNHDLFNLSGKNITVTGTNLSYITVCSEELSCVTKNIEFGGPCKDKNCITLETPDLQNYPYPFIEDGELNSIIYVGENTKAEEIVSSMDIASDIQFGSVKEYTIGGFELINITPLSKGIVVLGNQMNDTYKQNSILVGNPCNNEVINIVRGNFTNCSQGLQPGKGTLEAYTNGNTTQLVVAGYREADARAASAVLANYRDYELSGTAMVVNTATSTLYEADCNNNAICEFSETVNSCPDCNPDFDHDGHEKPLDCNDTNSLIYPGADELCDGLDNDCDTLIDEDLTQDCGSGYCLGTQVCSAGEWGDCSSKDNDCGICALCDLDGECTIYDEEQDSDCNDGLYCNGEEECLGIDQCTNPNDIDCSADDLNPIEQCDYSPDDNDLTLDYFSGFTSTCDEVNDECITGDIDLTHNCDIVQCGAECAVDLDCDDSDELTIDRCLESCICQHETIECISDEHCDDDLYCNGQETCENSICVEGTPVNCSTNNLPEIETCFNDPDNNPFTWDYAAEFTSTCDEINDKCTEGTQTLTHECSKQTCGAECESDGDCEETDCYSSDDCYDGTYRDYANVANTCQESCICTNNTCAEYVEIITDLDNDTYDTECDNDCDDTNSSINPSAVELCNGVDDNCNDLIDEGYADSDGDGLADCVDPDDDNDNILDADDNCPNDSNPDQTDYDKDGIGDVCDDTNEAELVRLQVEEFTNTSFLTQYAESGSNICMMINVSSLATLDDDPTNWYSFNVDKIGENVLVNYTYDFYCDGQDKEDLIFMYLDYESFLAAKDDPSCERFKTTSDGTDFYILPSKFVAEGGAVTCNQEFETKYCAATRQCLTQLEMELFGLDCCISCIHESDTDCNDKISNLELAAYANRWYLNSSDVSNLELAEAATIWYGGGTE